VVDCAERELALVNSTTVKHKHVVSLLQVLFDSPERQRVIMIYDLVDGVELFDLINSLPGSCLPEGRARRYFRHLRSAVEYIHQRGLAHRDIKPENCMIETATDHLKVRAWLRADTAPVVV
jgi:serine/threonine protein kinase